MYEPLLTADRVKRPRGGSRGFRPRPATTPSYAQLSTATILDAVAESALAFAAATDAAGLARAVARRMARVASAGRTTVWFTHPSEATELRLMGAWPVGDDRIGNERLPIGHAPLARQACEQGRPVLSRAGDSSDESALRCRPDAPLWVVPLLADADVLGTCYLAAERAPVSLEHVGRVLGIIATQAALALRALNARDTAQADSAHVLAVAAHDLKNTATSIKGYTQLLRRNLPTDGAARAARYSGVVEQQVGILCDALAALVDFGRVQSGRVALERERGDLGEILSAAQNKLPPADDVAELELVLPAAAVRGSWDRARLQRALAAVLDTARRASHAGDVVRVLVTVDGRLATLTAGETTPGAVSPRAGEWAATADMDLCLARGLVEAHGGSLAYHRAESEPPLLRVQLPLDPPPS
jgi:K+-sensing histidine kinase KdpD